MSDTIAAIATGNVLSAIGILRLSGPAGVATAAMVSVVLSIRTILLPGGALRQETQRFLQKIFLCKLGGKNPLTGVMKTAGLHTDSREST